MNELEAIESALRSWATMDSGPFPDYCLEWADRLAAYRATQVGEEWRDAVLDEVVACGIYTNEHDTNPRKAIQDAITWNCQVALDPAVSSDARKLLETHPSSPAGDWRMVPVVAREGMLSVGHVIYESHGGSAQEAMRHAWTGMLAAAPQPED